MPATTWETKGAVLLRAGVLTGWIGSAKQISEAQETAKNLISESISIFEALEQNSRVAEAQIDLACCYWREGAFDEGRIMLREALTRLTDSDIELRAMALLRSAIIEKTANRYDDALRIHNEAARLFGAIENHSLQGSFHNSFANVLENLSAAESRETTLSGLCLNTQPLAITSSKRAIFVTMPASKTTWLCFLEGTKAC